MGPDRGVDAAARQSRRTRLLHGSESDEVGNSDEHDSERDKKKGVGDEIRENHQGDTTDERHDCLLPAAVNEKTEADGTEQQAPEQRRRIQCGLEAPKEAVKNVTGQPELPPGTGPVLREERAEA